MDIVVIGNTAVKNEKQKNRATRIVVNKNTFVEKRRNRLDRRQSIRDGVVVRFSYRQDRRTVPDRRQRQTD